MKNIVAILFFIGCISTEIRAQRLDSSLNGFATAYTTERCYLHYDKSIYLPGETIWFKAYIMEGILPAAKSKNFYIDISDDKGNLLAHTVHPVIEGGASGNFDIPSSYKGKYLQIKAYTKWMLNFEEDFLYHKQIKILASRSGDATSLPDLTPVIQFFPEGGKAVVEVNGKIAFKASDRQGRPVKVSGTIVDNVGATIADINTMHDGMGYFMLAPKRNERYTAKWKDEKGNDYTTTLPQAETSAVSMMVATVEGKRIITVSTDQLTAAQLTEVVIIGTMQQFKVFEINKDISKTVARTVVPIGGLATGILTITVFDKTMRPLAERITFVNNDDYTVNPVINISAQALEKRGRNEIEILLPEGVTANMSIAVTDANIDQDKDANIYSHLLLTSEIKGIVHKPSYYFTGKNETIAQHLDLVMLTHGWRKFNWEAIIQKKLPGLNFPRDSAYLFLSGQVTDLPAAQIRKAKNITILVPKKNSIPGIISLPLQPNGMFRDSSLLLFDSLKISYQVGEKSKIGQPEVKFLSKFWPSPGKKTTDKILPVESFSETLGSGYQALLAMDTAFLLRKYEGELLGEVSVVAKIKTRLEEMDETYASGMFSSKNALMFDLIKDKKAETVLDFFDYIQGKVAGIRIVGARPNLTIMWEGYNTAIFIDEVRTEVGGLQYFPMMDIAFVKVFRPPFMGASLGGAGGAIAIYTKRGSELEAGRNNGMKVAVLEGYQLVKEFYSPDYGNDITDKEKVDSRTTLFWNPQLITNGQHNKQTFSFYNNDISKSFRVIIEGVASDGRLMRIEKVIE